MTKRDWDTIQNKMADEVGKCAVCGVESSVLQRCSRCKGTFYCGRECQRADWKAHKLKCRTNPPPSKACIPVWKRCNTEVPYLAKFICSSLVQHNFCIVDNFLGEEAAASVLAEVKALQRSVDFKPGQLSGGRLGSDNSQKFTESKLRGDLITWLEGSEKTLQSIPTLVRDLDELITCCTNSNQSFGGYRIEGRTKVMVAFYPGEGSGYVKHIDNPDRDGRCLTVLYYLNKSWKENDGGKLRLYRDDGSVVDIEPMLDRLLLFWSDERCPHEVLPSNSGRYAMTIWYFDSEQRRIAKHSRDSDLTSDIEVGIALKGVETCTIERNLARLKLEAKSEELVKSLLSDEDLEALSALVEQSEKPYATLTDAGIAPSIQEALMSVLMQRSRDR